MQIVVEEQERQRRALDDDRAAFRPLRPLVLGKGADRDQPLPDPHRDQDIEPERDAEAIGHDRQDHRPADQMQRPGEANRAVALADELEVAEHEADPRQPRAEDEAPDHGVVHPQQQPHAWRQLLMVPQRLVVALGIVERIGQPLVGMMPEMQRLEAPVRPDQADRQEHEGFIDQRIAGRMAVQHFVDDRGLQADGDRKDCQRGERIGGPDDQPANRPRPVAKDNESNCRPFDRRKTTPPNPSFSHTPCASLRESPDS